MGLVDGGPGHEFARTLLDGAGPDDLGAACEVIDDALRRRSNDPVVHAAALWLAFSARVDLGLNRSHARSWLPGLSELIQSGYLDAAAYALPRLKAVFPQLPYLESMAFTLRSLPAEIGAGREPFVDDRGSDVQLVRRPGADTLVLVFCGATHQLGISLNVLDRWFALLGSHVVYLRDWQKIGYTGGIESLGRDVSTTIENLAKVVDDVGARRVVLFGNSAGASGALRYAGALDAERVLALAPITGGPKYAKMVTRHLPRGGVMPWSDLVPLYGDGIRTRIVFGEKNDGDREQSVRMAGLPGVTVEALSGWDSHHLIGGLIQAGRLEALLSWLVAEGDDESVDPFTSSTVSEGSPHNGRSL